MRETLVGLLMIGLVALVLGAALVVVMGFISQVEVLLR
jgi:hypothetical protein